MKRIALVLALCASTAFSAEAQQHVISCPGVGPINSRTVLCDGFTVWSGINNGGTFTFFGDNGLGYLISPTDFTFVSALFQSQRGVHNPIRVYGYTQADIARQNIGWPNGVPGGSTYGASFLAEPDAANQVVFNWANVRAVGFDATGGKVPDDPDPFFFFDVSRVTIIPSAAITVTPEPASLVLLGTGLIGALGLARRQKRR